MSTDIVTARPMSVPVGHEVEAIARIARNLAAAGIYKKTAKTPEEVFAILLAARDMGVAPTSALAGGIHMVDGKPEVSANLQAQLLREYRGPEGQRYRHRVVTPPEKRSEECRIEFSVREPGEGWEVIGEELFTLADAGRAGLASKQVWKAYPKMMLLARCLSDGIASHCPETARGLRVYGEGEIGGQDPAAPLGVEPTPKPPSRPEPDDPEPVDAEVVPDRGEDGLVAIAQQCVERGLVSKQALVTRLIAEGATDTSSITAAVRSLPSEDALTAVGADLADALEGEATTA